MLLKKKKPNKIEKGTYLDPKDIIISSINQGYDIVPEKVSAERVPTLNGMGYVFYLLSPFAQDFILNEAKSTNSLFEIGSGFSNVAIESLKNGVKEYTANDISEEHLQILIYRIKQVFQNNTAEVLNRLKLLHGRAPYELPDVKDKYDAIIIDKVLHFLNPDEIEEFILWAKQALKKDGRLYILTISPHTKTFRKKLLPKYMERFKKGILYAGYVTNASEYICPDDLEENYPKFQVPQVMVFFTLGEVERLFIERGFQVAKTYSLKLPSESNQNWVVTNEEEGDIVGIVAINKK